jgi:peptidoglycan-associated lipoprotein
VTDHVLGPVYFDAGRSTTRPDDERILDTHAAWLKRNRNQLLLIEGHTDGPGRDATSLAIGEQRATWVKAYLVSKGVDSDRIETISYGGTQPMCTEKTAICRAKNRRATFSTTRRGSFARFTGVEVVPPRSELSDLANPTSTSALTTQLRKQLRQGKDAPSHGGSQTLTIEPQIQWFHNILPGPWS